MINEQTTLAELAIERKALGDPDIIVETYAASQRPYHVRLALTNLYAHGSGKTLAEALAAAFQALRLKLGAQLSEPERKACCAFVVDHYSNELCGSSLPCARHK